MRGSGRFANSFRSGSRSSGLSQSPSLRGSGRFPRSWSGRSAGARASQSPSLRGSGRFAPRRAAAAGGGGRLNPLHCGAVVASRWLVRSLDGGCSGLNPLHCGAVVASLQPCRTCSSAFQSQSPSLRGSGRFFLPRRGVTRRSTRLNPLHCGAVVASGRGFPPSQGMRCVSIPFIAGQWSLQFDARALLERLRNGLNPLHCGAVVASPIYLLVIECSRSCLNPLHCGAVVASCRPAPPRRRCRRVSIPFIAGQWSLLPCALFGFSARCLSQSPSLRGSGRFRIGRGGPRPCPPCLNPLHCGAVVASWAGWTPPLSAAWRLNPLHCGAVVASRAAERRAARLGGSQSPSLRGSGRFRHRRGSSRRALRVSIPFIAGQWSLQSSGSARTPIVQASQSPSLRGSGRFTGGGARRRRCMCSLNPLHCGAVVASRYAPPPPAPQPCLNPLHCGAVVASNWVIIKAMTGGEVSIPFIAGQWSLRGVLGAG